MKLKTRYCVLKVDAPDMVGITWPRAILEDALAAIQPEIAKEQLFSTHLDDAVGLGPVVLAQVSHRVTAAYLDENRVRIEVEVLDTPDGAVLLDTIAKHGELGVRFTFQANGALDDKRVVRPGLRFMQFPWVPDKPEDPVLTILEMSRKYNE